jgi:hypothetical protein
MNTKKTKEKLLTAKKSPLQDEYKNTSERIRGEWGHSSGGNSTLGGTSARHSDGHERCDWAQGRSEKITSEPGAKVASESDSKMSRPRAGGSGKKFTESPEQHDSRKVGKFLTKDETMGSNRAAHAESDVKLRVPDFRKGKQD